MVVLVECPSWPSFVEDAPEARPYLYLHIPIIFVYFAGTKIFGYFVDVRTMVLGPQDYRQFPPLCSLDTGYIPAKWPH